MRFLSRTALLLFVVSGLAACGAGSSLDEYQDGVPDVVPSPIKGTPDGGTGEGTVGSSCTGDNSCDGDGTECLTNVSIGIDIVFPGGYCTQSCQNAAQCPGGASCLGLAMSCLQTCSDNAECRVADGYSCASVPLAGSQRFCLPPDVAGLIGGGATGGGFIAGGATGGSTGGFIGGIFGNAAGPGGSSLDDSTLR